MENDWVRIFKTLDNQLQAGKVPVIFCTDGNIAWFEVNKKQVTPARIFRPINYVETELNNDLSILINTMEALQNNV